MKRPAPSTLVAGFALVVAASGTSYAAGKIESSDIANSAVTSAKIENGTIKTKDLSDGVLAGITGPAGADGTDGADGDSVRWVLINAAGQIEASSGGFSVTAAYLVLPPTASDPEGLRANGNIYINANEDLSDNSVVASIALQNQLDQNGDMVMNGRGAGADANPEFSGEIAATQCNVGGTTAIVACAPPGTGNVNHFVVSPRMSDGSPTVDGTRKRFYVIISGDSTDFVEPVVVN